MDNSAVGNLAKRGGLAPSVKSGGNAPVAHIEPSKTNSPLSLTGDKSQVRPWVPQKSDSKPETPKEPEATKTPEASKQPETPKADSKTAMSFKQAFAKARKEAGGAKGQFEYGGKKYQTNINPAKGAEKYISAGKQKVTSVNVPKADASAPSTPKATETPATQTPAAAPKPEAPKAVEPPLSNKKPPISADTVGTTPDGNKTYWDRLKDINDPKDLQNKMDRAKKVDAVTKDVQNTAQGVQNTVNKAKDAVDALIGGISGSTPKASGSVTTAPEGDKEQKGQKVNESVQIGDYKYRII